MLKGVSLEVPKGAIVALLGPNGAGKTTTLRAITGLLDIHEGAVTKGNVRFEGDSLLGQSADRIVARGIGQVLEGRRIFVDLTVEENLLAGAYARTSGVKQDLEKTYDRFAVLGERRHKLAGYLSGGEQQMLAISRALIARPRLLLLDEPSLGLAPRIVAEVAALIRAIRDEGVSILLVEQNAAVALELADHGYVMETGRIVVEGTADALREDEDVREFYLGGVGEATTSYRDVKRYRRRKRWLS